MTLSIKQGATSQLITVWLANSSSSTGAGLTGLTNASSGLVCYRARSDDGNAGGTAISLSAGTKGTWSSGGFVEKDQTNMPGVYEFGIPDAALASGSSWVRLMFQGATNLAPFTITIPLVAYDPQDNVHLGLSAIPNATAGASNGLLISGSNSGTTTLGALTVTGTMTVSDGVSIARSSSNSTGLIIAGSGTGHGATITSGSGATGDGVKMVAASTNGNGLTLTKTGTGQDLNATVSPLSGSVWDVTLSSHLTSGTTGAALNAAGSAGDPWSTALPGVYGAGTAGNIVGNSLGFPVGAIPVLGIVDNGTLQSASGTTAVLRSAANFGADNNPVGMTLYIWSGTGVDQSRVITAYTNSTDTATVDTWTTTPDNTSKYIVFPTAPGSLTNPAPVNVQQWKGTTVATPATSGIPDINVKNINNAAVSTSSAQIGVNVVQINAVSSSSVTAINAQIGTSQQLNFTGTGSSALVKSDMVDIAGAAVNTSSAQLGVNVVNAAGTAWNSGALTSSTFASGAINAAALNADSGQKPIRSATAQAGAATTITLDAGASASNNFYNNTIVWITGGTGVGQSRFITAYVGATKVATVATWVTNPDNTSTFAILPFDAIAGATAPTAAQVATAVWQDATGSDFTAANSIGKSLYTNGNVPGSTGGFAIVGSNMGTVTSVTGDVQGNVQGSVGSVNAGVNLTRVNSVLITGTGVVLDPWRPA